MRRVRCDIGKGGREMTEQEQIKYAKSTVSDWLAEETHWESPYLTLEDVKVIGKSLEKQIPKKAIIIDENENETEWKCPVCGLNVLEEKPESNYCQRCGQKLDWSEEE